MANYRQIHVSIWKDEWFLDLEPEEKLLFIYLFSNEATSLAGLYKIAFKVICFETGLDAEIVKATLDKFAQAGKVLYEDGVIWVVNMQKYHDSASPKVKTRIGKDIEAIPDGNIKIQYQYSIGTHPYEDKDKDENKIILEKPEQDPPPQQEQLPEKEKAATPLPLSAGQKKFLEYFGAKRFKTNIQRDTVGELEKEHGTAKLIEVVEWQAKQGMGMGQAVNSLANACKNWGKNSRASPTPEADIPMPSLLCGDGDRLRKRAASASGQRNYQALLQDYLAHLRSCRICSGGSNSNEIQNQIGKLAGKMNVPPEHINSAPGQRPPPSQPPTR